MANKYLGIVECFCYDHVKTKFKHVGFIIYQFLFHIPYLSNYIYVNVFSGIIICPKLKISGFIMGQFTNLGTGTLSWLRN